MSSGSSSRDLRLIRPHRVVIDTNVVVSALLSPYRAAAQVIDLVLTGEVIALFDDRITAEYREVTARPRFRFEPYEVEHVLRILEDGEHITARPLPVALPDPDDEPFAEVAIAGRADILITGNARHFAPIATLVSVRSPRDALIAIRGEA